MTAPVNFLAMKAMIGPHGRLPLSARKEHFSLAFVHMVTYAAGCSIKTHETDYDGVDITIVSSAEYERWYCPEFELQVKCTSRQDLLRDDHLAWTMEARPFRKLTNPKRYNAAYLGVLLIPADSEPFLDITDDRLLSRSRMYWQRAADLGTIREGQPTKTVRLPRSNLFDVEQLLGIMRDIGDSDSDGGEW
jgi:hypothetical protein